MFYYVFQYYTVHAHVEIDHNKSKSTERASQSSIINAYNSSNKIVILVNILK